MFNKKLEKEIEQLKKRIDEMPEGKFCSECGIFKKIEKFYRYGVFGTARKDYCDECKEIVDKKARAKIIAEQNPDKVIKCAGGKK
jgi:hypothetical protein